MTTHKFNQLLVSLGVTLTLLVNAYPQASRTVMVQSNTGVLLYPTNLWSANAASARSGLALAPHATNSTVPVSSGGSGATNAAGARTNLGLVLTALTNTNNDTFRAAIELGGTNSVEFYEVTAEYIRAGQNVVINLVNQELTDDNISVLGWSTNGVEFGSAAMAAATRTNLGIPWSGITNSNASAFRSALGLSANWLTNTNVTNFRTAIGLGAANEVTFNQVNIGIANYASDSIVYDGFDVVSWNTNLFLSSVPISFVNTTNADTTRTNLGLPLIALTNTSNVTTMRALSGSTNTNHPFSGTVSVVGTNNTNTLTFSNGILQSVQ